MKRISLVIIGLICSLSLFGCAVATTQNDTAMVPTLKEPMKEPYAEPTTEQEQEEKADVSNNREEIGTLLLSMEKVEDKGIPGSIYNAYFYQEINKVRVNIKGTHFSSAPDTPSSDFENTVYISNDMFDFIQNCYDMNTAKKLDWATILKFLDGEENDIVLSYLAAECWPDMFESDSYIAFQCQDENGTGVYLFEIAKAETQYFISHLSLENGGFPTYTKEIEHTLTQDEYLYLSDITAYPWVYLDEKGRNEYFTNFIELIRTEDLTKAIKEFENLYPITNTVDLYKDAEDTWQEHGQLDLEKVDLQTNDEVAD